ncbi:MAG TPA: ABC transporter substrate binding protein [Vicinamibacterales bacterium]|nr:ABC transporter substrate binding protein [Vicinamibacterales bacterium]
MATANAIASEVTSSDFDLIISASTASLQTIANANRFATLPRRHVFGLTSYHLDHPPYMTGLGSLPPVEDAFRLARELKPDLKRVGLVWNPNEANSVAATNLARKVCGDLAIQLIEANAENATAAGEAGASVLSPVADSSGNLHAGRRAVRRVRRACEGACGGLDEEEDRRSDHHRDERVREVNAAQRRRGLLQPDVGAIRLAGHAITNWPEHRRAKYIGRVVQNPFSGTAPTMSIAENLALASRRGRRRGIGWAVNRRAAGELRDRIRTLNMGLEDRLDNAIGSLSGGQRQALTLLMASWLKPDLLLLDEHTAALDPKSADHVIRLTHDITERDKLTALM